MGNFNAHDHLSKVKTKQGMKDYLQVQWRLVWFREAHPHGTIETKLIQLDLEKQFALFQATALDSEGGIATGHGSESAKDFDDYLEKAETKAIGRALAALGYGTQFAPELEEGERIVDSPVVANKPAQKLTLEDVKNRAFANGIARTRSDWQQFTADVLAAFVPDEKLKADPGLLVLLNDEITARLEAKGAA